MSRHAETAAYDPNGALRAEASTTSLSATTDQPVDVAGDAKTFVVYFGFDEKDVSGIGVQELAEVSAYADNLTTAEITISGPHGSFPAIPPIMPILQKLGLVLS